MRRGECDRWSKTEAEAARVTGLSETETCCL